MVFVAPGRTVVFMLRVIALLLAAHASWSAPQAVSNARQSPYTAPAVALDSRGDAAVAYETVGPFPQCAPGATSTACMPVTSVLVSVRVNGRVTTRLLWRGRTQPSADLAVAIGAGEVTVAWGQAVANHVGEVLRVAHGPLSGAWAPERAIAAFPGLEPFVRGPQLAAAPDGEVLMTWNACATLSCNGPGVYAAWRRPGHDFGAARLVAGSSLGAGPRFDAGGTAYLTSPCSGRLLVAAPPGHDFARSLIVAHGATSSFSLSLAGAGRGLASWVQGACSYDEAVPNTPGGVGERVLSGGSFAPAVALTAEEAPGTYAASAAVPAGGGTVSWFTAPKNQLGFAAFTAQIGPTGAAGAVQQLPDMISAVASDGAGDLLFARPPGSGPIASAVFVRPAGGGADEPAPYVRGWTATAAFGRGAALLWYDGPATPLRLSVWR
jgi:hypothetical protein